MCLWEPALTLSRVTPYANKPEKTRFSQVASELITKNQQLVEAREQNAASERERISMEQKLRAANEQLDLKIQERTSELTRSNQLLQSEIQRRVQTEDMLRKLSARILTLQDEERRRLGRELHDSAGQIVTALAMNIGAMARHAHDGDATVVEMMEIDRRHRAAMRAGRDHAPLAAERLEGARQHFWIGDVVV